MSLKESTVEAAALEWSGDLPALPRGSVGGQGRGDAVGHRTSFAGLRRAGLRFEPVEPKTTSTLLTHE
jgi:hypothetical protein